MKEIIILRGLPGSGKSSFAMELFELFENSDLTVTYASADTFFMVGNEYKFNAEFLGKAHAHCKNLVVSACVNGTDRIIVDNTCTTTKEIKPYLKYAEQYGYKVRSIVVENRHEGVSIHNVPESALERMESRFTLKLR